MVYQKPVKEYMRKKILILFAVMILFASGGCAETDSLPSRAEEEAQAEEKKTQEQSRDKAKQQGVDEEADALSAPSVSSRTAWCVYWDGNSAAAAAEKMEEYDELVLFGCIYEEDDTLHIPEALEQLYRQFPKQDQGMKVYLSFINDIMQEDGTAQQKSPDFLERVLKDDALGNQLIDDMVSQTKKWGLDGIELDYENIHKGEKLWDDYLRFLERLFARTEQEGLLLRVVLGAYAPVDEYTFPAGPQYVVMCYNLYGTHSGPGPKADMSFLAEMAERYSKMDVAFAIANGGFEWDEQGKAVRSLTAYNAEKLAQENGATPVRDESGALSYAYTAEDGLHTVWYGDDETMRQWEQWLAGYSGRDIAVNLWRLE